jgi:pyruvate/2-oxoglutarate dehydrogenase complex dihydrolipoamide acyltransferase (E2) component
VSAGVAIAVPRESNNDELVTLVAWKCRDGDEVAAEQVVAEVEGSKATFEVVAPSAGFVRRLAAEGQDVIVGEPLCRLFPTRASAESWVPDPAARAGDDVPATPTAAAQSVVATRVVPAQPAAGGEAQRDFVRLSRRAQELLERHGLTSASFAGRGLVRARDVLAAVGHLERAPSKPRPSAAHGERAADTATGVAVAGAALQAPATRRVLAPSKRTEARYIGAAQRATLPSSVTVAVKTRGLRAAIARASAFDGNVTALLVHECARLLRKHPLLNACYDAGEAYVYDVVNVGIAVDDGSGLKVPVIRDADSKSPADLAREIRELLVAYAANDLGAEQQSGGTFTITDLSSSNVLVFEPLINKGQAAILGVGAEVLPAAGGVGSFNLTLRFDHQLAEGRTAATFLNDLALRLEGHEAAARGATDAVQRPRCARCGRTHAELLAIDRHLVRTVAPSGGDEVLCTVCIQGW